MAFYDSDDDYEENMLREFVEENPFPTYLEMLERIKADLPHSLEVIAEYGEENHNCLRKMYESCFDKNVCREQGKIIYRRGGMEAMYQNYSAIRNYGITRQCENMIIRCYPCIIKCHWDGIGEWRS